MIADLFRETERGPFVDSLVSLSRTKQEMLGGTPDRVTLDRIRDAFELSFEMVFDLTLAEQEKLRDHVNKYGAQMMTRIEELAHENHYSNN